MPPRKYDFIIEPPARPSSRADKAGLQSNASTSSKGLKAIKVEGGSPPFSSPSTPPIEQVRSLRKRTTLIKYEDASSDSGESEDDDIQAETRKRARREGKTKANKVKKENEEFDLESDEDVFIESDEDVDVKPSRSSRSRAPTAPAAVPKEKTDEDDKKKIKRVKLEEEFQELQDLHLNYNPWPIPPGLDPDTFSVLDDSTWHGQLQVTGPEIDTLRQVPPFHFHVLKMGTAGTYRPKTSDIRKKAGYTHAIAALEAHLNLGTTEPGYPIVWTTGLQSYNPDRPPQPEDDTAIFVGGKKGGKNLRWKASGLYRLVWQGKAKDGEFLRLSEEKKKEIESVFRGYLKAEDAFSRLVFEDCYLDHPTITGHREKIRDVADETRQFARIRTCLEENRDLVMYWSLYVYTGDNAREVADCGRRRGSRYPRTSRK